MNANHLVNQRPPARRRGGEGAAGLWPASDISYVIAQLRVELPHLRRDVIEAKVHAAQRAVEPGAGREQLLRHARTLVGERGAATRPKHRVNWMVFH